MERMFFAQLVANSVIAGALYTLITLGFNLIYGATKFTNMAHGAVAAMGAYGVFFATREGWGLPLSIVAGVLVAGIVGVITDRLVFSPLRKKKARASVFVIASLGIFALLQSILSITFGAQFWPLLPPGTGRVFDIAGASVTEVQLWILGSAVAASGILFILLKFTIFGKVIRALSDDEEVAKMLGINTDRMIGVIFFLGSMLAGLAGILSGFDTGVQPTMGLFLLLEGAVSSIVGGIGSLVGGILGAFLLGFVENFGIWFIASQWKGAIAFGLLTIFLIFRPRGIMGKD
ncbi:MAG: branched-chain amino acid ABC transporter permease [Candidatus Liptonbacteria bacterium]|nr:branched-chain amino acid ABC transporter permease [Candidatus Liptonbacteria bacterium]